MMVIRASVMPAAVVMAIIPAVVITARGNEEQEAEQEGAHGRPFWGDGAPRLSYPLAPWPGLLAGLGVWQGSHIGPL